MGCSKHELEQDKYVVLPKKNLIILHPYFPITATSPKRPFSPVPKAAVVEMFDCSRIRYNQNALRKVKSSLFGD